MQAAPTRVIDFFNGYKQYVIPLFQRPYSWEKKNWEQLWNDLSELLEEDSHQAVHFMGAIVTSPTVSVPVGVTKHMVIDGQQRLTTIALLLCAIRDALPEDSQWRGRMLPYLENSTYQGTDKFKLLPTQGDREAFAALCDGQQPDTSSRMKSAYQYFTKRLLRAGEDIPRRALEVIERHLSVVSISLDDRDDPYTIFESLNFKGSPLTQVDLARNYFLMRFPVSDQEEIYNEEWMPVQNLLGEGHMPRYIRQFLRIDGNEVRKNEVYAALKGRLVQKSPNEVREFMCSLRVLSKHFAQMALLQPGPSAKIAHRLRRLNDWEVGVADPLILQLLRDHAQGQMMEDEVERSLLYIESFVVRREVCAVPTNQLRKIFLTICKSRAPGADSAWLGGTLARGEHGRRWPSDAEFTGAWHKYRAYAKRGRCRLLLLAFEHSYAHKEPASAEKATIEHIMPQTLTPWWKNHLGDDSQEQHELLLDTIGNLTLSGYNSELSNHSYPDKIKLLSDSNFSLNKGLAKLSKWGPEQIQNRAKELGKRAITIWPRAETENQTENRAQSD